MNLIVKDRILERRAPVLCHANTRPLTATLRKPVFRQTPHVEAIHFTRPHLIQTQQRQPRYGTYERPAHRWSQVVLKHQHLSDLRRNTCTQPTNPSASAQARGSQWSYPG
jgi:hypothetical protein